MKTFRRSFTPHKARGAVIIMFGLMLVVLVAFAGLAIDLGRFFVVKSELQNAMDACALSAASQLRPGQNDANALTRAVAYGLVTANGGVPTPALPGFPLDAIRNKAYFQSKVLDLQSSHISFSSTLNGTYEAAGSANPLTARYAKCDYPLSGLPIYFMQVLNLLGANFTTQTVSAMATATRGSELCNMIAVGICQANANPDRGLVKGNWFTFSDTPVAGWFGWMDYTPKAGGTKELLGELTGVGQCPSMTDVIGRNVTEGGKKTAAEQGWNTRFGIYNNKYELATAPPDFAGYAYFNESVGSLTANWPREAASSAPRAYDGTNPDAPTGTPNFQSAQDSYTPFQFGKNDFQFKPKADPSTTEGHDKYGRKDRRLVVIPILNCGTRDVTDLGCALMLNPFGRAKKSGPGPCDEDPEDHTLCRVNGKLEYLGLVNDSPCGTEVDVSTMSVLVK